MLSNTATPKYYGQFREKVLRGEIPVCDTISMEMNRIDNLIRNPGVYYDPDAVEHWIKFCEGELCLTDGSPFFMLDSFKLWGEQVYGWYTFTDKSVYMPNENGYGGHYVRKRIRRRLINKQYLIVARGAAKTFYAMTNQAYSLVVNPSTTHQITTAPTMIQAEEVMSPFRTSITKARGPVFKMMTEGSIQNTTGSKATRPKLCATKKGIQNFLTNSLLEVRPMRIDKLQGLQLALATIDEWLSVDIDEDPVGALEQGATKEQNATDPNDWLIICTSSEGTVRNGVGDDIKLELMSILKGEYSAPHTSIFWYKLDDIKEVANPAMWIKCNPNLGKTVTHETYQNDVERAEKIPSARNDILAKRFNLPMEGYTYFFSYHETLPHPKVNFWNMDCALGLDLSQGDDFCAFTFVFPLPNGTFGIKVRSYITDRTLMLLPLSMRQKYNIFLQEGSLIVMNGTTLRMMDVYDDVDRHILEKQYNIISVGYDPYNAQEFIERWCKENSPYGVEKVIQGVKTESVPLGEIKKLAEDRALIFDEELMKFSMGNAIVLEDTNGNRKLSKLRRERKIDNVSALMDAYVSYKRQIELYV